VPVHIARERNRILRNLAAEKKQTFMHSFVGQTLQAITLSSTEEKGPCGDGRLARPAEQSEASPTTDPHFTEALTDNYLKLDVKGSQDPKRWLRDRIVAVDQDVLIGVATKAAC